MARSLGVLSAVLGPDEVAFVQAVEAISPMVVLSRRCGDVAELLAAANAGLGRIAVVSADLPGLDRDAVATLLAADVRVVAVADPPEGWLAERTRALGIAVVTGPAGAVTAVSQAAALILAGGDGASPPAGRENLTAREAESPASSQPASSQPASSQPAAGSSSTGHDTSPAAQGEETGPPGPPSAGRGRRVLGIDEESRFPSDELGARMDTAPVSVPAAAPGSVVAVWGPTGAPGRTTLAVNLAAELAELSSDGALLIDADTYGGTVAQVLGMLDEAPGIAAAARAAGQGTLDAAALALLAPVASSGLRVVSGISRAARWAEIPGPSLDAVWDVARLVAEWTVIDCGFGIEDDEALSYDTRAPRRNAATLSALAAADLVVVVGGADPIGVQRLVRALGDLDAIGLPSGRVVVANRVRASAVGPRPGELIATALERYAGVDNVRLVPDDRAGLDAAVLRGAALREIAPGSAARKAVLALAEDLVTSRTDRLAADRGEAPSRRRRSGKRATARN